MSIKIKIGKLFNNALGLSIILVSGILTKIFYNLVSPKNGSLGGFFLLLLSFIVFFIFIILVHLFINYFLKILPKLSTILAKLRKKMKHMNSPVIKNAKMLSENSDKSVDNSILHCDQCGTEISNTVNFCHQCGSKISLHNS